jgi:restriction system protein
MSDISGRPAPRVGPQPAQPGVQEENAPRVPQWITAWGWALLTVTAAAVIWALNRIGHDAGAGVAWVLFAVALCGTAMLWWRGYSRRLTACDVLNEQVLYQQGEIEKVDAMTGAQFEKYCAALLQARGYTNVSVTGGTDSDHGVDITATSPGGILVAVQCKRWKGTVGPGVIRELIGATVSGRHQGLAAMLMTSAPVTGGAQDLAENHGVDVVGRDRLREWMLQVKDEIEQRGNGPQAMIPCSPSGMRLAGQVLAGILCCGLIMLILVAFPVTVPRVRTTTTAAKPSSHTALSAQELVVEEVFAAINRHDWPAVWRLWYHPEPGYGPGYSRMISGYRLTARDVVTSIKSAGATVTARVLAHETTGAVQSWDFRYQIHHGKIIWGRSDLLGTRHPRQNHPAVRATSAQ